LNRAQKTGKRLFDVGTGRHQFNGRLVAIRPSLKELPKGSKRECFWVFAEGRPSLRWEKGE